MVTSLFLAVFPDRYSATQLTAFAHSLRARHRLQGDPLEEPRFHVSLIGFAQEGRAPKDMARDIGAVVEEAIWPVPPFEVRFDQTSNFGRKGNYAHVLVGQDGNPALCDFQKSLLLALKKGRLGKMAASSKPHITLLYDRRSTEEERVEPVRWMVNELVLILSFVGQTKHVPYGRWKLRG